MTLLIQLILAHLIGDFFLQPDKWVVNKIVKKWASVYLYFHVVLHGLLVLLITHSLSNWKIALLVMLSHLLIDLLKLYSQNSSNKRTWFFIDQALHLSSLLVIWQIYSETSLNWNWLSDNKVLSVLTAGLFLMQPSSFIIKNTISVWSPTGSITTGNQDALINAGKWIGYLERILIFTFIMADIWEGVGFLLTAKSIFRFGDLSNEKDTKLTEYVLIGTLLSFSLAIFTGLLVLWIN